MAWLRSGVVLVLQNPQFREFAELEMGDAIVVVDADASWRWRSGKS